MTGGRAAPRRRERRTGVGAALPSLLLAAACLAAPPAGAQQVAVFGDNFVDDFVSSLPGFTATLVSDAQIATPGFLAGFDALVYTRNGTTFGTGLSSGAAAAVREYVGSSGHYVLLNADFADDLDSDAPLRQLFFNAVAFAAASGHGFVGEFSGAVAAVASNSQGFEALDLVPGAAGPLGNGNGGAAGELFVQAAHPVGAGLPLIFWNPPEVEHGADLGGVAPGSVIYAFAGGNPGILAGTASAAVDLSLDISESTADPATAGSGAENIVHTVTLQSRGPTATNLEIRSRVFLPAGVNLASITPSAGAVAIGAVPAGTGIRLDVFWSFPSYARNQTETLTIRLTAGPSADDGTSVNHDTQVLAIDQRRRNLGDDTDTEATLIQRRVTLGLVKTDSPDPVVPAGTSVPLTYSVLLTNNGPSDVGGLTLSDVLTLPAGVTLQSVAPAPGTTFAGSTWTVPGIPAGGARTLLFTLSVGTSTATGTDVVSNTVAVSSAPAYVTNPTASATQATSVLRLIDLVLTAVESADPVVAGSGPQNLTYTVTLGNAGPSVATGVRISSALTLPSGVSLDAAIPSGTTTFANSLWEVGTLEVGGSATLTLVMTVGASAAVGSGTIVDALAVAAATETRTNTGNDAVSLSTSIARHADLDFAKTDLVDPVQAGSSLSYLLTVTNDGPSDSTGATVTDTLPAQVTLVSATPSQGLCAPATGAFTCVLGPLARGATANVVATVTVATTASGTITNQASATVAATDLDPVAANNSALALTTVLGQANLALAKTDSPDPVLSGHTLTYQLTATNLGPGEATNVALTDTLPAGVAFVSASPPAYGCAHSAGVVSCSLGTLVPSGSAVVTLITTVGTSASGSLTNVATVVGNQPDPSPANNTATASTTVDPPYDLGLAVSDAPDPVPLGGTLVYTLTVTNFGPGAASGVTVADSLPAGVTALAATPSQGSCALGSGVVTCSLGSLASGAAATIQIQARVDPGAAASLANGASVSASGTDTDPSDNSASATTAVDSTADLSLAVADAPDPVAVGGTLAYTVTVSNAGPALAYGVTLSDPLPTGLTFLAAQPSQGTCGASGATVTCGLGTLASGASATVTIQGQVGSGAPSSLVNTASVAGGGPDPNPANGSASAATAVQVGADLSLSLSDSPDPASAGGRVTYTVMVQNLGPSMATGVVLTDLLPPGAGLSGPPPAPALQIFADGFESGSFSAWSEVANGPRGAGRSAGAGAGPSCSQSGNTVTCPLGALDPGETLSFGLEVTLDAQATGTVTNQASVAGSPADSNPANNSAAVTTTVQRRIDLALDLADSPDPVAPGGALTYTLTASNLGPSVATGVAVSDPLPPELTAISAVATQGSCVPGDEVLCSLGSLGPGAQAQVTISTAVAPTASGAVTNAASVVATEEELDLSNNSDTEVTVIAGGAQAGAATPAVADLAALLTVRGEAREGETVAFRLRLANRGGVPLPDGIGDELVDVLPAGLRLLGAAASAGRVEVDLGEGRVRWSGEVPARGQVVVAIAARVEAGAAGRTLANQAFLFFDGDGNGTLEGSLLSDDPASPGTADPTELRVEPLPVRP